MKIVSAIYKTEEFKIEVLATDINHKDYISKYRGHLYCTEAGCNAKLCLIERKKSGLKVFKTWPRSVHIQGCPNEVIYEQNAGKATKKNGEVFFNLSNEHINQRLKTLFEKIAFGKLQNPKKSNGKSVKHELGGVKNLDIPKSGIVLFNQGEDSQGGKQGYILERSVDALDDSDIGYVRIVHGEVSNIQINETHGYINYKKNKNYQVKVYFSEYFRVNNEVDYPNFNILKDYYAKARKQNNVVCLCVGRIPYVLR